MEENIERPKYKTIVMSDVHLGSKWSKTKEATQFLKDNSCENLILCGDIIDGWAIMRGKGTKWKKRHTNFIKELLDISHTTKIVYLRGNHDDFLDRVTPINFLNMEIVKDYTYASCGKRYYILHGDLFDTVTTNMSWLAKIGDVGYDLLLWINYNYNRRRVRKGLPYRSISSEIKCKVKASFVNLEQFEKSISEMASDKGCDGVICGHTHVPDIKEIDGVKYMNSGDWVESLTALVEDWEGNWSIYRYDSEYNQHLKLLCVNNEI